MGINKREEYELFNLKNNFGIKTNTNKLGMNKFWLEFRKPLREAQFQNCLSMAVMGVQQHQDFLNCRLLHLWRKFYNIISKAKVQCKDFFLGHSFSNIGYKCMLIKKRCLFVPSSLTSNHYFNSYCNKTLDVAKPYEY